MCGEAGQGIQTVEQGLTQILKRAGYFVYSTKEYMSRVRGGTNSTLVRVSSRPISAFVERIDLFIPFDTASYTHLAHRVTDSTFVAGDSVQLKLQRPVFDVPLSALALSAGGAIYSNTISTGFVLGLFDMEIEQFDTYLSERYASKGVDVVAKNIKAGRSGFDIGRGLRTSGTVQFEVPRSDEAEKTLLLNGAEALAFGAIAGGCNFVSSYPMSPSTSVLTEMAKASQNLDIVVEQAEDEIAGINMAIGAWYAGARGMTTTSGGGFALMTEGLSLAGMLETPVVVYLAMRPGPATGLPTRTEQGDLDLVRFAGHGDFPRAIYAPGTFEDAVLCMRRAFNTADRFQVPAIVLADQYFVDTYMTVEQVDIGTSPPESHIVKTTPDYKRYAFTTTGISPRGIPGYGEGLVLADSDEHTEEGLITEDETIREAMVKKRLLKQNELAQDALLPEIFGAVRDNPVVVCWGSTFPVVQEAVARLAEPVTIVYFRQVWPLPPDILDYFDGARSIIVVESNVTGQFANVLSNTAGVAVTDSILKHNGLPFSVEELTAGIAAATREGV
jgi:2-oxoglutarate ferredoxin oxidoreductase subunit alpha